MNDISIYPAETIIKERLLVDPTADVFPITLVKYLLNKDKILNFFNKLKLENIKDDTAYIDSDNSQCDACINNTRGMSCRKHTSIDRVANTSKTCYDEDFDVYLFMNEIYRRYNDRLVIVYTPHTKLIQGPITKYKVKKISTLITDNVPVAPMVDVFNFKSSDISNLYIKCWFNNEFSLVIDPEKINNDTSFCLIPNK